MGGQLGLEVGDRRFGVGVGVSLGLQREVGPVELELAQQEPAARELRRLFQRRDQRVQRARLAALRPLDQGSDWRWRPRGQRAYAAALEHEGGLGFLDLTADLDLVEHDDLALALLGDARGSVSEDSESDQGSDDGVKARHRGLRGGRQLSKTCWRGRFDARCVASGASCASASVAQSSDGREVRPS